MLKIEKREATIQDFLKLKKHMPIKHLRNAVGKALNFQMIFGGSAYNFATTLEKFGFSEQDCDNLFKVKGVKNKLNEAIINNNKKPPHERLTLKRVKYLLAAELMKESFFTTYKGLADRIKREFLFCRDHFYVRDWHGTVRHIPEFMYMSYDPNTQKLVGSDAKLYNKRFNHACNQSANSAVQTGEGIPVYCSWIEISNYIKEWNLKSWGIWNSTHDSFDMYIRRDELELITSLAYTVASKIRPPYEGIGHRLDGEISDISLTSKRDNYYYKHGEEQSHGNDIPIEKAIDNYNKKHGTSIKWSGVRI